MPSNLPHRWVIVLAGGRGSRLSTLTRDRAGTVVPKQFCSLHGGRSLLADALARAALLAPPERTLMVVVQQHERFWLRELAAQAAVHVVVQPRECGTAPGVLLPLLAVLQRDPEALVTLLPSDHFVGDEASLAGDLRAAQDAAASAPHRVLLLGIRPDAPEPEYGYVLPGPGHGATRKVAAFVEKPAREHAAALIARGAVWNAFLVVARAGTLLEMYAQRLPGLLAAFAAAGRLDAPQHLEALYQELDGADFSRELLGGSEPRLGLRVAAPCGWTDLGTPDRVRACIARHAPTVAALAAPAGAPLSLAAAVGAAGG